MCPYPALAASAPGVVAAGVADSSFCYTTARTVDDDLRESEMSPEDCIGMFVVIWGIKGKVEYNGLLGLIRGFDSDAHRVKIKLAGVQTPMLFRPTNVREVCYPPLVLCSICRNGDPTDIQGRCPYCGAGETLRIQELRSKDPNHIFFQFMQDPSMQI